LTAGAQSARPSAKTRAAKKRTCEVYGPAAAAAQVEQRVS
jgi:hypothetical protein